MNEESVSNGDGASGGKNALLVSLLGLSGPSLIFMSSFLLELGSVSPHESNILFVSGSFINSYFLTDGGMKSGAVIAERQGIPAVVGMVPGGFAGFKVSQVLEDKSRDVGKYAAERRNPRRDDGGAVNVEKFA